MINPLKLWKLNSALKNRRNNEDAYAAVVELGRLGTDKAIEALTGALSRLDGVARSAARELGRLQAERAIEPLAACLGTPEMDKSVTEALARFGPKATDALARALQHANPSTRRHAAEALGETADPRSVEPLVHTLGHDDDYAARIAAADALGRLKDPRALWVLVATLQLRGETQPERQRALDALQEAARRAMRKIGDPLAARTGTARSDSASEPPPAEATHPRLAGNLASLSEADLLGVLRELVGASEEISWAKLENRAPLPPPHFQTYDQRSQIAEIVGRELKRRGGRPLLEKVLERDLGGYEAIRNWWAGLMD